MQHNTLHTLCPSFYLSFYRFSHSLKFVVGDHGFGVWVYFHYALRSEWPFTNYYKCTSSSNLPLPPRGGPSPASAGRASWDSSSSSAGFLWTGSPGP